MKNFLLNTFIIVCLAAILPLSGYAAGFSAGAATWYAWMKNDAQSTASALYYGPVLSAKLNNDFGLSFIFLYGKFNNISFPVSDTSELKFDMSRIDSDITVNYNLNDYFKIFSGVKYMSYKFDVEDSDLTVKHNSLGPGAGVSAIFPLVENFYLIGSIGGLYLWGEEKAESDDFMEKLKYNDYGINSSLSLSYYIDPVSTTISLGARYQYIETKYETGTDPTDKNHFYGITLSAIYSFSL